MNTHKFTKEVEGWCIDFPEHLYQRCRKTRQIMVEGASAILDRMAHGDQHMTVVMDTKPFQEAVVLELRKVCQAPLGGGYYLMRNCMGKVIKKNLWLCDIPLFVFGDLPERIYIKKVAAT